MRINRFFAVPAVVLAAQFSWAQVKVDPKERIHPIVKSFVDEVNKSTKSLRNMPKFTKSKLKLTHLILKALLAVLGHTAWSFIQDNSIWKPLSLSIKWKHTVGDRVF